MRRFKDVKAIFFDLDGTLANTQSIIIKSYNIVLKNKVKNVSSYFGPSIHDMAKIFKKEGYIKNIRSFVSDWKKTYIKLAQDKKLIDKNTLNTLNYLKQKYIIGIITSSDKSCSDATLGNYKKIFNFVVNTYPKFESKPNPEALNYVINKYNIKKKDVIYVGDSIYDIKFANNARVRSIAKLDILYNKKQLQKEKPKKIIENISELQKIL